MHPNPRRIIPVVLLLAATAAAIWYFNTINQAQAEVGALTASGTIEATQVLAAAEVGGQIAEVLRREGETVQAGEVLVRFDSALLQAQLAQAEAALNVAKANYDLIVAGPSAEQRQAAIAAAELELTNAQVALKTLIENAALARSQAEQEAATIDRERDKAQQYWDNLNTEADQADIDAALASMVIAKDKLEKAQDAYDPFDKRDEDNVMRAVRLAALAAAQKHYDIMVERYNNLVGKSNQYVTAEARANLALLETRLADAKRRLEELQDGPDPDELALAQARVKTAEANLVNANAETPPEQIAAAQAQVDAAAAALLVLQTQIDKLVVKAPSDGVVLTRSVEPGEVAAPGAPLFTLARLDDLTITVYVPEDRYGEVSLGEKVRVAVDSFPGETFEAVVTRIADQAEFTPRNVQTEEGRRTTVYAVELAVANPDGRLKPGMPADVTFGE